MSNVGAPVLFDPHGNDPLGYGLRSIAEPLQRWWLFGQGNPYFDADVRNIRPDLEIPEPGFTDAAAYVDWVAQRASRHGHDGTLPVYFRIGGQVLVDPDSLTRLHYRDLTWPLPEQELPSRCCPTDPLFEQARRLAFRYGVNLASFEPGFPKATESVVRYVLVNRWPHPQSLKGRKWTETIDIIVPNTGERLMNRVAKTDLGLKSKGGEGRQLPMWYEWWKLHREGRSISDIAGNFVDEQSKPRIYDERTIRHGIDAVETLMKQLEKPS